MATEEENEDRQDPADDEEKIVVPIDEPAEDDAEPEPAAARATRAEKKAERLRLREHSAELERSNAEMRERLAKMEGVLETSMRETRAASRQADRTGDDPLQAELDDIYDRQQGIQQQAEALGAKITDAQYADLTKKARQLDQRKGEILAARVLRQQGGPQRQDPNAAIRQGLEVSYSDVYANGNAREWAKGEYNRLINHPDVRQRQPDGLATVKLALENARKEFGMARSTPTANERGKYAGVPRGGTGGSSKPTEIRMDKDQQRMANLAFSHLKKPDERMSKWAKGPGKRLAEARAAKR